MEIYCDGACSGNPGPGGWAIVFVPNDEVTTEPVATTPTSGLSIEFGIRYKSGHEANTTNNRMELMAAIMALIETEPTTNIIIYTDSVYVQKGITEWIKTWVKNGWNGGKVKNVDLWQRLLALTNGRNIAWKWVKGHSGNKYNDLADQYARLAVKLSL